MRYDGGALDDSSARQRHPVADYAKQLSLERVDGPRATDLEAVAPVIAKVQAVVLVIIIELRVNVVPASTTSLPCVTRSVAKNQFGVVEDAMSVNLSVA